jgi:hypothetical protein
MRHSLFFCWLCFFALVVPIAWGEPLPLPPAPQRPGADGGPTKVGVTAWFSDISKIDSAAQSFSASLIFRLQWQDPSLAHPGPEVKTYSLDQVWHPRWIIANGGADLRETLPETVDVSPDGGVLYRQRLIGTFNQLLNLRRFPFESEVFTVNLVLLGTPPQDVELAPAPAAISSGLKGAIGRSQKITMQDWNVTGLDAHAAPYSLVPGTEIAGYDIAFSASRLPQHYLLKVILPLILIVFMSWAVFWIDPTLGSSQISVAVTSMLTLIAYRFAIGADVPKLPYLTLLDEFILLGTVLVFLSLIEVMVTTRLALNDRIKTARTIDRHARWGFPLTFAILSALIFLR